jgi:outer membrane protein assembly factor BamB
MTALPVDERPGRRPLRLWPGIFGAALILLIPLVLPAVVPGSGGLAMLATAPVGALVILWWLFFSRAPWLDRLGAMVLMVGGVAVTFPFVHQSVANGFMGRMLFIFSVPVLSLALVGWVVATRGLSAGVRRLSLVPVIALACATFLMIRTGGITGDAASDLHWRWTPTPEERLLAQGGDVPVGPVASASSAAAPPLPVAVVSPPETPTPKRTASSPAPAASLAEGPAKASDPKSRAAAEPPTKTPDLTRVASIAEWPGFRGAERDGVVRGVQIETDWSQKAPVELWRRPIGPGWSSFAVHGDFVYTQEQRGDEEMVSCYQLTTGQSVWRHGDAARFYESNGGPGPRGTPLVHGGRVYALGATGILNALDAGSGARLWSRNAAADTEVEMPGWGFTSSPLVIGDVVIVALSGRLAGYDVQGGALRWLGPAGGAGYSSPHLVSIDGVEQIVLLRGSRTISVAPADGTLLWEHTWQPGVSIVQPALAADHDILLTSGDAMGGLGIRRIAVSREGDGWKVEERWTSRGLKPYFNDLVVHKGHAFGFDGSILAAIDLADGARKWKGGRYGHGQMVLLPDQDLLLVLSEDGALVLVKATADKFTEVARVQALEGKTWNHPVLIGDVLLIRNGEQMAAFKMPMAAGAPR